MAKITLAEKLQLDKVLNCNLMVSSRLISKLEVYGYVNSCRGEDMKVLDVGAYKGTVEYNDFVNNQTAGEIICSDYMMQPVVLRQDGSKYEFDMRLHQIYSVLEISKENLELKLSDIDIPSLFYHSGYKKLRSRNSRKSLNNSELKTIMAFSEGICVNSIIDIDYVSNIGDVLCKDADGRIKSIGEHLMAVCRYLSPYTGMMCYTKFHLDELFYEE